MNTTKLNRRNFAEYPGAARAGGSWVLNATRIRVRHIALKLEIVVGSDKEVA